MDLDEIDASKEKTAAKRQAWNKGLVVGKRDGFTPAQVKRIRGVLADRGVPGLRDPTLFSTAIDTMLQGQDLLDLVGGDVQSRNGSIRALIEVVRGGGWPPIRSLSFTQKQRAAQDRCVARKFDGHRLPRG